MEILRMTFIEAQGFNEGRYKSYDTNLKGGMIEDALMHSEGGSRMTASALSRVASTMIRPGVGGGVAHIENGWSEHRMRFAMLVRTYDRAERMEYKYITGYTDFVDFSEDRDGRISFNPRMKLYFNSVSTVDLKLADTRLGERFLPKLMAHDQILDRGVFGKHEGRAIAENYMMRPSDLFRRRQIEESGSFIGRSDTYHSQVFNTVGRFTSKLSNNTRQNNSPSSYLSRSIREYVNTSENYDNSISGSEFGYDREESEILAEVSSDLRENLLQQDPLFDNHFNSEYNYLGQGYITYGDLMDMNPDFDEDQLVGFQAGRERDRFRYIDTDDINGNTPEAIAANILAHSLPSLMLNAMYSRVEDLIINTYARQGEEMVIPSIAFPYVDGLDVRATDGYFIDQIEKTIIPDITIGGDLDIEARVTADIDGVVEIWISVDGGPEEYFVSPVFADALLSPVLTQEADRLDRVSSDILQISNQFFSERARNRSTDIHPDDVPRRTNRKTKLYDF